MSQLADWEVVNVWDERPVRDEDFLRNSPVPADALAAEFHRACARSQRPCDSVAATFAPAVLRSQLEEMVRGLGTTRRGRDRLVDHQDDARCDVERSRQLAVRTGWRPGRRTRPAEVAALQDTLRATSTCGAPASTSHSEQLAADAIALPRAGRRSAWRDMALLTLGAEQRRTRRRAARAISGDAARVLAWFAGRDSQVSPAARQMRDTIAPMIRGQRTWPRSGGHVSVAPSCWLSPVLWSAARTTVVRGRWDARDRSVSLPGTWRCRHHSRRRTRTVSFWDGDAAHVEQRLRQQAPAARPAGPPASPTAARGRALRGPAPPRSESPRPAPAPRSWPALVCACRSGATSTVPSSMCCSPCWPRSPRPAAAPTPFGRR
jgi:hypothetical protein